MGMKIHPAWSAALLAVCMICLLGCKEPVEPARNDPSPKQADKAAVYDFEGDPAGNVPSGFTAGLTGGGGAIRWEVQEAADAPSGKKVVAQLSDDETNRRYPILIRGDFSARDVDVSVKFKTLSGKVDASGGIVWRYRDEGNYYVARANSLEGNVVAYKTEKGKRSSIGVKGKGDAYGVDVEVLHRKWNTLRVIAKGNVFEIHLNGRKLFEVENDTFKEAGRIGLWTKADAVSQFDDLRASSLDAPR